jgi:hypothetical protein
VATFMDLRLRTANRHDPLGGQSACGRATGFPIDHP